MAKQRYVYMRDEIEEKLKKEPNASRLINDLLEEHYRKIDPSNLSAEELERLIRIEKIKQEYENKLKEAEK